MRVRIDPNAIMDAHGKIIAVFDLITAHTSISAQSIKFLGFKVQSVQYYLHVQSAVRAVLSTCAKCSPCSIIYMCKVQSVQYYLHVQSAVRAVLSTCAKCSPCSIIYMCKVQSVQYYLHVLLYNVTS